MAELRAKISRAHEVKAVDLFYGYDRIVFDFDGYEAWATLASLGAFRTALSPDFVGSLRSADSRVLL